jgi:hypothetical protein
VSATIDISALTNALARLPGCSPLERSQPPRFVARGPYSLDYVFDSPAGPCLARLVTGSQLGLSLPAQARYEARALALLEPSGRAPRLVALEPEPLGLPCPLLVETHLPGRPLNYASDMAAAARCVADVHALGVPREHALLDERDPGRAIVAEARDWAAPYLGWHDAPPASLRVLRAAFASIERDLPAYDGLIEPADLAIVNYNLNTHNFSVDEDGLASLVVWEKARVAPAAQDLAHFLLPTTTLWRDATSTWLAPEQEQAMLEIYLAARSEVSRQRFLPQLAWLKRLVALRAVTWCAWVLATAEARPLTQGHDETLIKCAMYLEPDFLAGLFGL